MKVLIITKKIWNTDNLKNFTYKKNKKTNLSLNIVKKYKPNKIFFIHWSKFIPKRIYENYECIQFHCSDLPKFRGGSPIQNQIIRGIKKTKLTAFKVSGSLDAGPIYLKKSISLSDSASKIYSRIEKNSFNMIKEILKKNFKPQKQFGKTSFFNRREKKHSRIPKKIKKLDQMYDFIRMLDAETYPKANIKLNNFQCEFYDSKLIKNFIYGKFKIKK